MTMPPDPAQLAQLLGPPLAHLVLSGEALVEPLPAAVLPDGALWQVSVPANPHVPRVTVASGPAQELRLLTGRPAEFNAWVADLPLHLADGDAAVGLVRVFLETTRDPGALVQVPRSSDEVQWRPPWGEEEGRRDAFLASTSFDPLVEPEGDEGYVVAVVQLTGEQALRVRYRVSAGGVAEVGRELLADGLPLPVVL